MEALGLFVVGIFLLLLGGDSVVKGSSGLSQRMGLSPFAAGALLLTFATSIPELVVNGYALAKGDGELALGNAIGSNVVNIGLTLGLAAITAPLMVSMRLVAAEIVAVLAAAVAVLVFGLDGVIVRWEGGVLLAGFVAFVAFALVRSRRESPAIQQELKDFAETRLGLALNLSRFVVASAVLFFGAKFVVQSAPEIGQWLGFGSLLTGMTLVAIGTALPEVVVSVMAARNGQGNIVAGMALGACVFNLLFIVGGMAVYLPVHIPASFAYFELPAVMAFALALYPMLSGNKTLAKREGITLVALFALWLACVLAMAWA